MKRALFTLLLTALSIAPMHVFAAQDCATGADIGKTYCTCDDGTTTFEVSGSSFDAASCNSACFDRGDSSWTLESCDSPDATNPGFSSVDQGNVSDPDAADSASDTTATAEKQAPDFLVPNLIVKIPGFEGFTSPTTTDGGTVVSINFLAEYINAVYGWLLAAGALVAVVMMMLGGLQYVLARGKPKYIDKAKTRITNAITGVVLLLAAYNIAFLIDPRLTLFKALDVQYVPYVFISTENTEADITALTLPDPAGGTNGVPYFSQRSYSQIYGISCSSSPTIKSSGCGPTSAAMVLQYYGLQVDPVSVAASFDESGYRVCGAGTSYQAFSKASIIEDNGFTAKNIPISQRNTIEQYLKDNKPIIISVGPSRFTRGGHFMVLTGIDSEGNFMLNDPNSGYKTATKSEIYDAMKFATYLYKK